MTKFQIEITRIHRGIVSIVLGRNFYEGYSDGFLSRTKERYKEHNDLKEMNS